MKDEQKTLAFSVIAALFLWTADAATGAFIFRQGTFLDLFLFNVPLRDLYSRLLIISGLAVYGVVITKFRDSTERNKLAEESRAHREQLEKQVEERTEKLSAVNELLHKEIHDRSRTEEELYRSESFLSTIFDSFHDPLSIVDRDYQMIKFNDAYTRVRNKLPKDLFGKKCYEALYKRNSICEECVVEKTFQSADPCAKEKLVTLPNGAGMWLEIYTYPIFDQNRNVTHVIQYARDITDRKKAEEEKKQLITKLNHLSTTDSLTGLLNRRALTDTLNHEIDRAQRYDSDLSLLLCDVDKFKKINDTYGHAAGDRALQAVAESLKNTIRKADILGRYGGDEFMIILPETSLDGAKNIAEKIRLFASESDVALPGKGRIRLTLSIGVAGCCTPLDDIDTLVSLADTALYTSKEGGRNRVSAVET